VSWLLDTDVMSQPVKDRGNPAVTFWINENWDECYTSTIVIAQVAYWIRTKEGRNRQRLQTWLTRSMEALEGRILSFNISVAHVWAEQRQLMVKKGYTMPAEDSYIAATACRHGLTIVTGNDRDFRHCGVKVLNPFKK
jgi:toxin FitB